MNGQVIVITALATCLLTLMTVTGTWLVRHDNSARRDASQSTRVDEVERRLRVLETDGVGKREFDMLNERLTEIRTDIREIRRDIESARASNKPS